MDSKEMKMGGKTCGCPCHKTISILVVLFGLIFLLGALNIIPWQWVDIAWPILVIIAGITKMCKGMCSCCAAR